MPLTGRVILLTFLGGALGTTGRFVIGTAIDDQMPMLFVVNLLGAFALGWFNSSKRFDSESARAFWGVGFAGGFTTMSGVASAFVGGLESSLIVFLVLAMLALGVVAYRLGLWLGSRSKVASE